MAYMYDQSGDLLYGGMSLICKQCNRKVLEKCISCGCFKPEKKPPPSALCGGCGQPKAKCPPEDGSDEDVEEEDYIKQAGDVLRRKCSCCNRARDSCTKCGRAYISDSEEDCESEKDSDDAAEDNEDEEEEISEREEEQTPPKKQKKAETKGVKK